jgi:hypothetical protein
MGRKKPHYNDVLVTYEWNGAEDSVSLPSDTEGMDILEKTIEAINDRVFVVRQHGFAPNIRIVAVRWPDGELINYEEEN